MGSGRSSGVGWSLAMAIAFVVWLKTGVMWIGFVLAGVLFFVSALPLFLFVRPPQPVERVRVTWGLLSRQFPELWQTIRSVWRLPPVLFFFIGNFLCVDVVNTLIMWTRRYLEGGPGFSEKLSLLALLAMGVSAFPLGLLIGFLTDWVGPKRMMLASQASMLACIAVAASATSPWVILPVIVVLGSSGLAGTWTAGRKWLLEVAPPEKVGEFFGLYGITVKLSVFGCTLFAAVADWIGYRVALSSLLVPLAIGIVFLAIARPQRVGSAA